MDDLARDPTIRHRRTHDHLFRDFTRDPIFLLQTKRYWYAQGPYDWDSDNEEFSDEDGEPISRDRLVEEGYAGTYWDTIGVFLTREDGEEWAAARGYRWPDGWRVYCICAEGDLVHVLAAATLEGRYG